MKRKLFQVILTLFLIVQNGAFAAAAPEAAVRDEILRLEDLRTPYHLRSDAAQPIAEGAGASTDAYAADAYAADMGVIGPDIADYTPAQEEIDALWERMTGDPAVSALAIPEVGHQQSFYEGQTSIQATLVAKTSHLLIYVNDKFNSALYPERKRFFPTGGVPSAAALAYAEQLEQSSHFMLNPDSANDKYFGQPYDLDSNGGAIVLITNFTDPSMANVAGYFTSANFYPRSNSNPRSNYADMFYVEVSALDSSNTLVVIHELQHLINFSYKLLKNPGKQPPSTEYWLNEGLSELTRDILYENNPARQRSLSNYFFLNEYGAGGFSYLINNYG
ncbi:MAG: hypothetical protein LBL26_00370 [Peptococcaceae bacterium]|jgi:hypothetical protein|nr:hypothetical protein [Peptococcaceae bacterium]